MIPYTLIDFDSRNRRGSWNECCKRYHIKGVVCTMQVGLIPTVLLVKSFQKPTYVVDFSLIEKFWIKQYIYTAHWCILMHIAIQICVLAFVVQCRHVFTGPVLHRAQFWCKSEASTYFPTIGAYWHTLDARRSTKTMADKVATMLQYEAQMPIRCRRCNHADDICTIVVSFAQKYNERKCWYGRYFRRKDLDNHLDHS